VAQLIVRDIEDEIVRELKRRAAENGRSAEEEHRQILRGALKRRPTFHEVLSQMPDVGEDSDFERVQDFGRDTDL
jgi:plasmid stability protein